MKEEDNDVNDNVRRNNMAMKHNEMKYMASYQ